MRTTLPPSAMRVLAAMAVLQSRQQAITWRKLLKVIGRGKTTNAIAYPLKLLQKAGLIKGVGQGIAVLRPTCRFIPANQLGDSHEDSGRTHGVDGPVRPAPGQE